MPPLDAPDRLSSCLTSFVPLDRPHHVGSGLRSWAAWQRRRKQRPWAPWAACVLAASLSFADLGARLKESVFLTAKATAMVCWMFVGSWTFASVFSYLGGHDADRALDRLASRPRQPWAVLDHGAAHHLSLGMAAWSGRRFSSSSSPSSFPCCRYLRRQSLLLRHAGGAQSANFVPDPAHGHVRLLPQGRGSSPQIELMQIFRGIMPYLADCHPLAMVLMYLSSPAIALWFPDSPLW